MGLPSANSAAALPDGDMESGSAPPTGELGRGKPRHHVPGAPGQHRALRHSTTVGGSPAVVFFVVARALRTAAPSDADRGRAGNAAPGILGRGSWPVVPGAR